MTFSCSTDIMFSRDVGQYAFDLLGIDPRQIFSDNHLRIKTAAEVVGLVDAFRVDWSKYSITKPYMVSFNMPMLWAARYGDETALVALNPWISKEEGSKWLECEWRHDRIYEIERYRILHSALAHAAAFGNIPALKGVFEALGVIDEVFITGRNLIATTAILCGQVETTRWLLSLGWADRFVDKDKQEKICAISESVQSQKDIKAPPLKNWTYEDTDKNLVHVVQYNISWDDSFDNLKKLLQDPSSKTFGLIYDLNCQCSQTRAVFHIIRW